MISGVDEAWHRRVNAPAKKQMSEPTHITAHVMSLLLSVRRQHQQYLKHLLTFRPQQSTNRKQSAGDMTDVLDDTDGSYLPSVLEVHEVGLDIIPSASVRIPGSDPAEDCGILAARSNWNNKFILHSSLCPLRGLTALCKSALRKRLSGRSLEQFLASTGRHSTCKNKYVSGQRPRLFSSLTPTLALVYQTMFHNPLATHHTLLFSSGQDVCGLRFTYPSTELLANCAADVFLLVSPTVPSCCYSYVQISKRTASALGLNTEQMLMFCHATMVSIDEALLEAFSHCLVLLLRRENALCYSANLPTGLMNELALHGLVQLLRTRLPGNVCLKSHLCFHVVPYAEYLFNLIGDHMWTVPDFSPVILLEHSYASCSETEQIVILTLTGHNIMEMGMSLLHKVLRGNQAEDRFELLALKWLPTPSWQQARELSPFEVSERQWHNNVVRLVSSPALVFAITRPQAFRIMKRILAQDCPGDLSVLMSTPQ
ncbi:uncharacterized protein LOC113536336 isoform X2 [Tachysurus ichikawai]